MHIVLLDEARRRFEAEDDWWREHRDAAELFADEFEQVLELLRAMPGAGQRYRMVHGKLIQRVLMKKTGCHVYYYLDRERDLIEIHSIWGARQERGPRLKRSTAARAPARIPATFRCRGSSTWVASWPPRYSSAAAAHSRAADGSAGDHRNAPAVVKRCVQSPNEARRPRREPWIARDRPERSTMSCSSG